MPVKQVLTRAAHCHNAQVRCDQCDRPIDGPAYHRRGQPVCANCWDKSEEAEAERAARRAFEASWNGSR